MSLPKLFELSQSEAKSKFKIFLTEFGFSILDILFDLLKYIRYVRIRCLHLSVFPAKIQIHQSVKIQFSKQSGKIRQIVLTHKTKQNK